MKGIDIICQCLKVRGKEAHFMGGARPPKAAVVFDRLVRAAPRPGMETVDVLGNQHEPALEHPPHLRIGVMGVIGFGRPRLGVRLIMYHAQLSLGCSTKNAAVARIIASWPSVVHKPVVPPVGANPRLRRHAGAGDDDHVAESSERLGDHRKEFAGPVTLAVE